MASARRSEVEKARPGHEPSKNNNKERDVKKRRKGPQTVAKTLFLCRNVFWKDTLADWRWKH